MQRAESSELGSAEYEVTRCSYNRAATAFAVKHADPTAAALRMRAFVHRVPAAGWILDAGCGPGRDAKVFVQQGFRVVGVDYSEEMVKLARSCSAGQVFLMDLRDLRFHDETFDGIWANASVHHLSERDLTLVMDEFFRILKPGGALYVSARRGSGHVVNEEYPSCPRYYVLQWSNQLRELVSTSGFQVYAPDPPDEESGPEAWVHIYAVKPRTTQLLLPLGCRMCSVASQGGSHAFAHRLYDKPLLRQSGFVVVPALGHIVEGYVLIVSEQHVPCMGALPAHMWADFGEVKRRIRSLMGAECGPMMFFEHGSVSDQRLAGNSVVHAHTHACPAVAGFIDVVRDNLPMEQVEPGLFSQTSYLEQQPYLLIEDEVGRCYGSHPPRGLPSQYLRRLLSSHVGLVGQWDWQRFPHQERAEATLRRLSACHTHPCQ